MDVWQAGDICRKPWDSEVLAKVKLAVEGAAMTA